MTAVNETHLNNVPWKLYVATYSASIPTLTAWTNDNTVASYIDANLTFQRLASVIDLNESIDTTANQITVDADECDTWTIYKSSRYVTSISATWFEWNNPSANAIMLGLTDLNVAGAPVAWASQVVASWAWSYNVPIRLANKHGAWLATINSVTGGTNWALVVNVDYIKVVDSEGYTTITIIDSATVTTQSQTITINYDYTPTATKYQSYIQNNKELPRLVVKLVTCPDENSKTDTYYYVDASLSSALVKNFIDPSRAWDLTWSEIWFEVSKWGYRIHAGTRAV